MIDNKVDADLKGYKLDIYFTPWLGYNLRSSKWINDTGNRNSSVAFGNRFQGGASLELDTL